MPTRSVFEFELPKDVAAALMVRLLELRDIQMDKYGAALFAAADHAISRLSLTVRQSLPKV